MSIRRVRRALHILFFEGPMPLVRGIRMSLKNQLARQYKQWLLENPLTDSDLRQMRREQDDFSYQPVISIITPVYNVDEVWLSKCIDSVTAQIYPHWELCLADDASTEPHVRGILEKYRAGDERIKVVSLPENRGIAGASNAGIDLAAGEFIALLDNDDELTRDALFQVVRLLNQHPDADMIYSDEDKLNQVGERCEPFFKPDWSPELFLSQMYTCHFGVYRQSLVETVGAFREGFDGSQDYDFVLRLTEQTDRVFHIPRILYHWRMIPGSTAENYESKDSDVPSLKALAHAMHRRGWHGTVERGLETGTFRIRPNIVGEPLVSIIIPTRDRVELLRKCVDSISKKTTWPYYEIIVVDNGSEESDTLAYLADLGGRQDCRVIDFDGPFNYAAINNRAAGEAAGEVLVFLNNDTEVGTGDWLEAMLEQVQRDAVGAVGVKLLYPDDTIQHAGIILGLGGIANPAFYRTAIDAGSYFNQASVIRNYSAVTGACMMVRKALFTKMGGFDEQNLPIAYNDIDLCLRLRQKGFRAVYTPFATIYHDESASRGFGPDPEADYMQDKWSAQIDQDPFYNPNLDPGSFDFSLRLAPPL
ncbi:MAG: glycosyltransferase family 2 protein [Thermoleophilia bacterium]